jgi:murein DD-endopeptidase MepM/ murein hydrolase activator NlpD
VKRGFLGLGTLAAACIVAGLGSGCRQDAATPVLPEPERIVQGEAPVPLQRAETEIRRGEPLDLALRRLELPPAERARAAAALATEIDLRRILPGERVEVARDGEGRLRELALERDVLHRVLARFEDGADPVVELVEREPDVSVQCIRGTLDSSLYESVLAAGADANLVMRYADLLAWQVDFLTEPRPGDRFRILVEKERLGDEELGFGKILAAEYRGARATARAMRYVNDAGELDWYDDRGHSVRRAFLKSPLNYRRISSRFSAHRRHPILKTVRPHWGVDYAAPVGTPVSALGSGVVTFAGRKGGYGKYVEVRHSSTYTTCYGHLSRFARGVRRGARIEQGQVIAYVGSTGLSTGPHLDFRVKKNGRFVDPLRVESPPGRRVAGAELARFAARRDRVWRLSDRIAPGEVVAAREAWDRVRPGETKPELLALAR